MTTENQKRGEAGMLGMKLFLLSLSVLFLASLAGHLIVHSKAERWIPPDVPRIPGGFWISTLLILIGSAVIESALRAVRRDDLLSLRRGLVATSVLAVAFLLTQTWNWIQLLGLGVTDAPGLYAFTFFTLTGLHALHILGGLIQLSYVTTRAMRGAYRAEAHAGILYARLYWHFLAIVWMVMFIVLFLLA